MDSDNVTIIIDNGSSVIKAGNAGNLIPSNVFPSIVGHPHYPVLIQGGFSNDEYVGDVAIGYLAVSIINYPIKHGIVTNWDETKMLWHNIFFNELRVDPSEHPILITEHAKNPKSNREKMMEIMFESFYIPSFYVSTKSTLPTYAYNIRNCIVCHIGDGVTHISPIINNTPLPKKGIRQNFGGHDLTDWLGELLNESGYAFTTTAEKEIVREIKEKHTYVALDYEKELQKSKKTNECNVTYTLPDGNDITISDARFRCPELLFKPQMNGFQFDGIHMAIHNAIMECDDEVQNEMYQNILLSGGCTMINGFAERLEKEIKNLAPQKTKVKVIAEPERNLAAWKGGSAFASLDKFPQMLITSDEYVNDGPDIVHRKCF